MAILTIEHHYWHDRHFAGLHERENFKSFIMRPKAPWKQCKGIGLLCEIQFARKKVIKIDEFWITMNGRIRRLFKRKANVETKALFRTRALLGRAHDSISAAGDDHVSVFHNLFAEIHGLLVFFLILTSTGTSKDSNFAHTIVFRKDTRCVTELAEGAVHELEFADARVVATES